MTITKKQPAPALEIALDGRLDTMTAPELEAELKASLPAADSLVLDFSGLDYISSAGLRVLLSMQKRVMTDGSLVFRNVQPDVMDVFEMTGFSKLLTFE